MINLTSLSLFSTPWYIYLVFIYLFYRGLKALAPHSISLLAAWLIGSIAVTLIIQNFLIYNNSSLFYFLAFIPGLPAGIMAARAQHLSIDPLSKKIVLPGSSGQLIYFTILAAFKLLVNFLQASYPLLYQNYLAAIVIVGGALISFFWGCLLYYIYYYFSNRNKLSSYWGSK